MKIILFIQLAITLIIISLQKQQFPPIKIWEIPLENFFKNFSLNFSSSELGLQYNKLEDHRNCIKQNLTYYLFLIQTQLQLSSYLESIEYRSYLGICLPFFENLNEVHLIQITKYYLWDLNNLTNSIIMDYDTPILNNNNKKNNKGFYTILFYLLSLLIFNIYVSFFPIDEKFESKNEMENIKKNLEQNLQDNLILNENINFDTEEKENIDNMNFYKKLKIDIYNSFNLKNNILMLFKLDKTIYENDFNYEKNILNSIQNFSYIFVSFYTTLPIIEKIPILNPYDFYNLTTKFFFQILFNGDYFYNIIFTLTGFKISYFYIRKKNIEIKSIIFYIFFQIFSIYFLIIIIYLIYSDIITKIFNLPLTNYYYNEESYSCNCQRINIFLFIANFTYGLYEKFFPFCVYHFWAIFTDFQYYIIGLFLVFTYLKFYSLFIVIFILIVFNCLIMHIYSLGAYSIPLNHFQLINRNLKFFYGRFGFKIFTRAGPFLIGFIFGVLYFIYKGKKEYLIYKIQENKKLTFLNFFLFFGLFLFQFNLSYINMHGLINFNNNFTLAWIYNLFKHDLFTISIIGMIISILSNNFKRLTKFFSSKLGLLLQRISLSFYVNLSLLVRLFFYQRSQPLNITGFNLILYYIFFAFINIIISILFTALFSIPCSKISKIIEDIYLNQKD